MKFRNLFKRQEAETLEKVIQEPVIETQPRRTGKVHTHTKKAAWSLDRPHGGGVRRGMPRSLRKMKEQADGKV